MCSSDLLYFVYSGHIVSPNLLHGASFAGKLGLGLAGGLGLNGVRIPLLKIISLV